MADARIQVPREVKRGSVFEVKLLVRHPMEPGFRLTDEGRRIARNVIRELTCRYGGVEVFRVEPSSGIAANPFFAFPVVARESGEMVFEWTDDAGARDTASVMVTVAG